MIGLEFKPRQGRDPSRHLIQQASFDIENPTAAAAEQMQVHSFERFAQVIRRGPMRQMYVGDDTQRNEPIKGSKHRRSVDIGRLASDR